MILISILWNECCVKTKPAFFKIDCTACKEDKKFSRNFLEYLNPKEFQHGKTEEEEFYLRDEKPKKRKQ